MHLSKPLTVPLFVPGHRPELLSKAAASGADAVIMDLEDAVSEADKPAAHEALAARSTLRVPLVVRCNGFGSIWFEKDLEVLAETPPDMVMLPKAESASHIELIAQKLGSEMPIIPIIESALGLGAVEDIMAHPSVLQCAFGHLDFSLDIGAESHWEALHYARGRVVLASRLGNKARRARDMGFGGKLLIHPKQISPAKGVFRPSDDDYAWAKRVMGAVASNASAVQLDGAMIDVPVIKRAEAIIRDYEALA